MGMKPETKIVNAIQEWVAGNGGKALKYHGDVMGELGTPDLMVGLVIRTRNSYVPLHIMVEVKLPGKEPDPIQVYRLEEWANQGFMVCSVTSLEEFVGFINREADYQWNSKTYKAQGNVYRVKS